MRWLMSANDPKRTCQIGGDGQIKEMALRADSGHSLRDQVAAPVAFTSCLRGACSLHSILCGTTGLYGAKPLPYSASTRASWMEDQMTVVLIAGALTGIGRATALAFARVRSRRKLGLAGSNLHFHSTSAKIGDVDRPRVPGRLRAHPHSSKRPASVEYGRFPGSVLAGSFFTSTSRPRLGEWHGSVQRSKKSYFVWCGPRR
jgi:hypothetical protein